MFFRSFVFLSRFFVKDNSTTVLDRNFKFGIQVHNDKLYRGIENGPFFYLFFHIFVLFFSLSRFLVKDISTTVLDRNFKFGIQVHNDKLYRGIENGPCLSFICSSIYLFFFSLSRFFVKDISTAVLDRNFNYGIEVRNNKLYCGIANGHSPIFCIQVDSDKLYNGIEMFVSSCIRSLFFLSYIQYCNFSFFSYQLFVVSWDTEWPFSY